jgi:hypothetical protein
MKAWDILNKSFGKKEPTSFAIFLEVMVDDEVTTLVPLNKLCGLKVNVFSKI